MSEHADGYPVDTEAPEPNGALHRYEVDAEAAGERLDKYLAIQPDLVERAISRTRVKSLIEDGRVAVRGRPAKDAGQKLAAGDRIELDLPPPVDATPLPENIPLAVVYEDDALIVIDKPAGLVVHPAAGNETGTLVNALLAHCGDSLSGIGGVRRPGIVHRLDKDTSGLLVVAKTDTAHRALSKLFADHGRTMPFVREYRAIVWGMPTRAAGIVDAAIERHPTQREKMAVTTPGKGREAVTHWRVATRFEDPEGAPLATEIICRLETGRTHQIRVHMAHLGHPILGDETYAAGFRTKASRLSEPARAALTTLGRQALHAAALGFPHPLTGAPMHFESALPPDLRALRDALAA